MSHKPSRHDVILPASTTRIRSTPSFLILSVLRQYAGGPDGEPPQLPPEQNRYARAPWILEAIDVDRLF
jgi:hypothetical protein